MGNTRDTGYLRNVIAYDSAGRIGIGGAVDSSYIAKLNGNILGTGNLTLSASGTNNHNLIFNQISNTNGIFQGIDFKDGNSLIRSAIRQEQTNYTNGWTDLIFYNGPTSLTEVMRFNYLGTATFQQNVILGGSGDKYFMTNGMSSTVRRGVIFGDGATIGIGMWAGGNTTLGNFIEGVQTLFIGTNAGGGSNEKIVFQSAGRGNLFSMDAANSVNTSYFPLTIHGINTPLIVNSTNSNGGKIVFRDAGTNRGYVGATSANCFDVFTSAGDSRLYVSNTTLTTTLVGSNPTLRIGTNAEYATLQYSGGSTILSNVWANSAGYVRIQAHTAVYDFTGSGSFIASYVGVTSGLYGPGQATYLLPVTFGWEVQSGNSGNSRIGFKTNDGVLRGYVATNNTGVVGGFQNTAGNWVVYFDSAGGGWMGGSLTQNSDEKLKNINDKSFDLSDISAISYTWNKLHPDADDKNHYGYRAQDILKVMPDAVSVGQNGYLGVNYIEVLVAKVQMLEDKVVDLQSQIKKLK